MEEGWPTETIRVFIADVWWLILLEIYALLLVAGNLARNACLVIPPRLEIGLVPGRGVREGKQNQEGKPMKAAQEPSELAFVDVRSRR